MDPILETGTLRSMVAGIPHGLGADGTISKVVTSPRK